ncbi:probable glutathione S-transferase parC isoform X1 [Rosa rugosa]|uniref:probable glutathione S-transferase parC isoform X1 n=1 Tax=Rosa rugosa TaxID=74645 RepID=UPI002B408D99|nr:probable glutathione S-transferase parC isoform X1 [Rosa rugosa]
MADEVVLLGFLPSPFAARLKIALAEKGVEYEYKEEDLRSKSPLLVQMNPVHKKVPVLIHNGKPICESLIALQYIDEVWNDKAPLLPSDPGLRAQARFWADFIDKKEMIWAAKEEEHEVAKEFFDCIGVLEGQLGDKAFFGGETLGFVDVAVIPFYSWLSVFEKYGNCSVEAKHPKFTAWTKRCMEKESVSKSLPDQRRVYDFKVGGILTKLPIDQDL